MIRLDFEELLPPDACIPLEKTFIDLLPSHDLVLFSDYAKGSLRYLNSLIHHCQCLDVPSLVDPKQSDLSVYSKATILTPNYNEFVSMVGVCSDESDIELKGQSLIQSLELQALLITRGEKGLTLLRPGEPAFHQPSQAQEVYDVTGAGDTVIATLAACVAGNTPLETSVVLANLAAGFAVARLGTAAVTQCDLANLVKLQQPSTGVVNEFQLKNCLKLCRVRGERIVLTNGCFDILHAGHIQLLQHARDFGDRLVVAVNSDESVKRLKGSSRPINTLERRMAVLSALSCVDWVVPFEEDTPELLISCLLPDVLVKGADYRPDQIAGASHVLAAGGEVRTVELVDGVSSTAILKAGNIST